MSAKELLKILNIFKTNRVTKKHVIPKDVHLHVWRL